MFILHCDPTMSHYLKLMLDCIFGENNFRNEIVWCYSRPSAPKQKQLSRVHDIIFWYSKGKNWKFNPDLIRQPYADSSKRVDGYKANVSKISDGGNVVLNKEGKFPESWIYISPIKGNSKENIGYPTQKPLALLERIINASSNEGDIVLDPFCGCATTCVAAEKLKRKWIGIDVSHKAYELVKERLVKNAMGKQADLESDFKKRGNLY
ncbi:MAG: DNA-methyltransferase [Arenicellales bacterium WSBS_2016_MAG_OTU3]